MASDGSESKSRKRKTPAHVSPNACTNCKKARAKCDGNDPNPCTRCASRRIEISCHYEVHVKTVKEEMVRKIRQLEAQNQDLMARLNELGSKDQGTSSLATAEAPSNRQPQTSLINCVHRTEQILGLAPTEPRDQSDSVEDTRPTFSSPPIPTLPPQNSTQQRSSSVQMLDLGPTQVYTPYPNSTGTTLLPSSTLSFPGMPSLPTFASQRSVPSLPSMASTTSFTLNIDDQPRGGNGASVELIDHLLSLYCTWWGPISPIVPNSAFPISNKNSMGHPDGKRFSSTALTSAACALGSLMLSDPQRDVRGGARSRSRPRGSATDSAEFAGVGIYFAEHALRELDAPFEACAALMLSHSTAYVLLALYEKSNASLRRGKSFLQCAMELVAKLRVGTSSSAGPSRLDRQQRAVASRIGATTRMLGAVTYSPPLFTWTSGYSTAEMEDLRWIENEPDYWWPYRFPYDSNTARIGRTALGKDTSMLQKLQETSGSISEYWYAPCEHNLGAEARARQFMRLAEKLDQSRGNIEQLYSAPRPQLAAQEQLPELLAFRVSYVGSVVLLLRPLLSHSEGLHRRDTSGSIVAQIKSMTRDGRRTLELFQNLYSSRHMHVILAYWCCILTEGAFAAFEYQASDWANSHQSHDLPFQRHSEERDEIISFATSMLHEMSSTHQMAESLAELIRRAAEESGLPGPSGVPPTAPPLSAPGGIYNTSSAFKSRRRSASAMSSAALTVDTCLDTSGWLGLGPPSVHLDSASAEAILVSWSRVPNIDIPPLILSPGDISPALGDDRHPQRAKEGEMGDTSALNARRSHGGMSRNEERRKRVGIERLVNP
ncbi:hypothetical protein P152DRAFT_449728 [Eremomyces bilateralis CBS 781.70]|uniref:Zn(2)-C6 fungal-type domain-containing protein n=1 Tax=Eremomyces bilateralis CBS 781.70 TaxID=1392243 RepID=A0A6G1G1K2_9PEZI|nr:uncharacterized protein P152DRAFT_449728 [Eremomyces bilateralis CBS 781.70]KAF1811923.1 hypothetical protein P152DRAFT_449728 [Eremomyces bilateralis CBS 781.70]